MTEANSSVTLTMRAMLPLVIPPAHQAVLMTRRQHISEAQAVHEEVQEVVQQLHVALDTYSPEKLARHGLAQELEELRPLLDESAAALGAQRAAYSTYITASILPNVKASLLISAKVGDAFCSSIVEVEPKFRTGPMHLYS
jgi:hypothetical protein